MNVHPGGDVVLVAWMCAAALAAPIDADRLAAVDAHLSALTESGRFSGHVVIADGTNVLLDETYGQARWPDTAYPDAPLFRIGSLTKQFTAAIVYDLADQGRLDLNDALSVHLPELNLIGEGEPVRLTHLVHHTSGVTDLSGGSPWSVHEPVPAEVMALAAAQVQVQGTPGAQFAYSNTGYLLLGEVIRRVTGGSYEDALASITRRAGLVDTVIHRSEDQQERLAAGHLWALRPTPSRELMPGILAADHTWEVGSDGSISSSAYDMIRWVDALRTGRVLSPAALQGALEPGLKDYAGGWQVTERDGGREVWHNGALSPLGYSSDLGWSPETGRTIVVLRNLDVNHTARGVYPQIRGILDDGEPPEMSARFPDPLSLIAIALRFHLPGAVVGLLAALAVRRAVKPASSGRLEEAGSALVLTTTATAFAAFEGTPGAIIVGVVMALGTGWSVWRRDTPWVGEAKERTAALVLVYGAVASGAATVTAGAIAARWFTAH